METLDRTLVLERALIRGQYESVVTDTGMLAGKLSAFQDVGRLASDFDNGVTPVRDVGGMFTGQRTAILEAYQAGTIGNMATTHLEILSGPVRNLYKRVVSGDQDQPVGHNFFVNASGFLDAGLSWAKQFDDLLRIRTGASIYDLARSNDKLGKDRFLAVLTKNPDKEVIETLAVYLAGRSLEGERYLWQYYGNTLDRAKGQAYTTTQDIAETTDLRSDMLERVAGQLRRATFGSFDHLEGLVTSENTGAAGDYLTGSLRVEVQFDGSVSSARLRDGADALHVVAHELQHAASAQTKLRCGLRVNGQGLEANEGMTEYLTQLSLGNPGIERSARGTKTVHPSVPYRAPVFAMLALHEQFKGGKNRHFATLFNAYHGDVTNQRQLEAALDEFYRLNFAVSESN